MSRTHKAIRNVQFALFGQVVNLLLAFVVRFYFIRIIGAELLGASGIINNILAMLSLAELGVGATLTFTLYEPLANKDYPKIRALLMLYKRSYIVISFAVLLVGLISFPFFSYLVPDLMNIENIYLFFTLVLLNSVLSFFNAHHRSYIIASENGYLVSIFHNIHLLFQSLIQIFVIVQYRSFGYYLIVFIPFTVLEGITFKYISRKLYKYGDNENSNYALDFAEIGKIRKNVFGMFFHKIGNIVVNGTDNILIARFADIVSVGKLMNFSLVSNSLNSFISLVFDTIISSIGNLVYSEDDKKIYRTYKIVDLVNFSLYFATVILLYSTTNHFILFWIGRDYIFSMQFLFVLLMVFYVNGRRKSQQVFKYSFGLTWNDKYKPVIESLVNLIFSIILGQLFGAIGVILGTLISALTTFWIEPVVVYKYGLKKSPKPYFYDYFVQISLLLVSLITFTLISSTINTHKNALMDITIALMIIASVITYYITRKSNEDTVSAIKDYARFIFESRIRI